MTEDKYCYCDENGNVHILTEDDLPKCPRTGGISPSVFIIGDKRIAKGEPINCGCDGHIFCKEIDEGLE